MVAKQQAPLAVYAASDYIDIAPGVAVLESAGFRVAQTSATDIDGIAAAAADAYALLIGYGLVNAELVARLPHLEIVSLYSQGHDNVDLESCARAGVGVAHLPALASEEVATHAWAMTLALVRNIPHYAATDWIRAWQERPRTGPRRLSTLTIGIVGTGSTAERYAKLAGPHVAGMVSFSRSGRTVTGAESAREMHELLAVSDVVTLHTPLTPETRGMVDDDFLARMRTGSYLINISRGDLIDPHAVARALDRGQLAGVALDVLDQEPPGPGHPLLGRPDVLLTPHVAWLSQESEHDYATHQAASVVAHFLTHGFAQARALAQPPHQPELARPEGIHT